MVGIPFFKHTTSEDDKHMSSTTAPDTERLGENDAACLTKCWITMTHLFNQSCDRCPARLSKNGAVCFCVCKTLGESDTHSITTLRPLQRARVRMTPLCLTRRWVMTTPTKVAPVAERLGKDVAAFCFNQTPSENDPFV